MNPKNNLIFEMVELPEVVLKLLFDFLGIRERLRVRSTCKKWKFVVDTLSHQRSVCIHSISYPYNERWCLSDQRVTEEEMICLKFSPEASRPFDLRMQFFRNLQKVYLFYILEELDFFLEEAIQLTRLKVLMIEGRIPPGVLKSSSLEKLSLKGHHLGNLQLNTPNLNSLILRKNHIFDNDSTIVKFDFPLKVKYLQCDDFTENLGSQLKNLETLVCIGIKFDFRLNEFESLTKAELWSLAAFQMVQSEKRRLNRTNLQVFGSGFDEATVAREPSEIQEQFFCTPTITPEGGYLKLSRSFLEKVEGHQWKLASSIPWKFQSDVRTFVSFASRIPRIFFEKFRIGEIGWIRHERDAEDETEIEQSALLVELVEKCKPNIYRASEFELGHEDVERLCRIQSIRRFHRFREIENADCLFNLKNLEYLDILSPEISVSFIYRLFKELKFFRQLIFASTKFCDLFVNVEYYNTPKEWRNADNLDPDILYSLYYTWGPVKISDDDMPCKTIDCKNLDELDEGLKRMREDEIVKNFFI